MARYPIQPQSSGFNTVETYIPWALHEPQEGQFQAEGMLDFEAYFKLVEEMGLYLIVRPTPYICAEFDFGGLPAWLFEISFDAPAGSIIRCFWKRSVISMTGSFPSFCPIKVIRAALSS